MEVADSVAAALKKQRIRLLSSCTLGRNTAVAGVDKEQLIFTT